MRVCESACGFVRGLQYLKDKVIEKDTAGRGKSFFCTYTYLYGPIVLPHAKSYNAILVGTLIL